MKNEFGKVELHVNQLSKKAKLPGLCMRECVAEDVQNICFSG